MTWKQVVNRFISSYSLNPTTFFESYCINMMDVIENSNYIPLDEDNKSFQGFFSNDDHK